MCKIVTEKGWNLFFFLSWFNIKIKSSMYKIKYVYIYYVFIIVIIIIKMIK